jgi:hypothetical protein
MLLFHKFPSPQTALEFALAVQGDFDRKWAITNSSDLATWVAAFPFECAGPIVLIGRAEDFADEDQIIEQVTQFGGKFAGT